VREDTTGSVLNTLSGSEAGTCTVRNTSLGPVLSSGGGVREDRTGSVLNTLSGSEAGTYESENRRLELQT
jgi:hypothetical protein